MTVAEVVPDWTGRPGTSPAHRRIVVGAPGAAVHVRVVGQGPPLVLVHMSPLSSEHVLPLAELLAATYTCYLPDTPGYGLSDPLPGSPAIEDYAARLKSTLDQLGLDRAACYGAHTGAKVVLALSRLAPDRVTALVLDGIRVTDEAQRRARRAGYAPRFEARDGGGHLVDTWHRVWTTSAAWAPPWPAPVRPAMVAGLVRAELRARPWYGVAYQAAFQCDPLPWLADLTQPTMLLARTSDPLSVELLAVADRFGLAGDRADDRHDERDVAARVATFLAGTPVGTPAAASAPGQSRHWRLVPTSRASVSVWTPGSGRLHPDTALDVVGLAAPATPPSDTEVVVDLPGIGASEWRSGEPYDARAVAATLDEVADALGLSPGRRTIRGIGAGATVTAQARDQLEALAATLSGIEPQPSGSHLIDLWTAVAGTPCLAGESRDLARTAATVDRLLSLSVPASDYLRVALNPEGGTR